MKKAIKEFGEKIWQTSRNFTLRHNNRKKARQFVALNDMTLLRKSLESDEILFMEGKPTRAFCSDLGFEDLAENRQANVDRDLGI